MLSETPSLDAPIQTSSCTLWKHRRYKLHLVVNDVTHYDLTLRQHQEKRILCMVLKYRRKQLQPKRTKPTLLFLKKDSPKITFLSLKKGTKKKTKQKLS